MAIDGNIFTQPNPMVNLNNLIKIHFFSLPLVAVTTRKSIMKLILFVAVVMFKCSRLSSAPADLSTESNGVKNTSDNDFVLSQPAYIAPSQAGLAYVSDGDDVGSTGVVYQFRRSIKSEHTDIAAQRRSALDKGFMRFGRAGGNMLRFGRSPGGEADDSYELDDSSPPRVRKSDKNILRFGRAGFMRFGRNYVDDSEPEDYNDAAENEDFVDRPVLRSPESNRYSEHGNKILRLGRSSAESVSNENFEVPVEIQPSAEKSDERNSNKKADRNMMRFGRAGNMMRFGRGNMMRFGKRGNMLRFGRGDQYQKPRKFFGTPSAFLKSRSTRGSGSDRNLLRLGRAGNLIRFGRNEKNLMRFGKRSGPQAMSSSTKIYCEDDDCLVQENENQLLENQSVKGDQLQELFGDEATKQGYGEYIIEKK